MPNSSDNSRSQIEISVKHSLIPSTVSSDKGAEIAALRRDVFDDAGQGFAHGAQDCQRPIQVQGCEKREDELVAPLLHAIRCTFSKVVSHFEK